MIIKWLSSEPDAEGDLETARKIGLINTLSLVGIGVLSIYGTHYLIAGKTTLGLLEVSIALSFALVSLRLRKTRAPWFACLYSTTVLGFFFLYLIVLCSRDHALWAFVFPLVAFFLMGLRGGAIAILLFFALCATAFLLELPSAFTHYAPAFEARFLGSLATVSLIAFFFELLRERFQEASHQKQQDIELTLGALEAATSAMRESEAKYREVVERASDGILIIQERIIRLANSQIIGFSGYTEEELIGSEFTRFIHEDALERILNIYRNRLSGKPAPRIYESAIKHKDGHKIEVEINSGVIAFEQQPAVLVLIRDITRRRRAEEEKADLEDQLRHSQKMEAVGELAGGVAHDFNNMLSAISGFAQMIMRRVGDEDPTLTDYANTIREASNRAADLTAKLLAFARKGKLEEAPLDLHSVITDVVKLLERTIDRRIRIRQDLKAPRATVIGDRSQLLNTILNLAVNARDAMPRGGVLTLRTSLHIIDANDPLPPMPDLSICDHVCLTVSDTGIGMDIATQDRVFEPFFTTKAIGKGTGLGLASAYGTVKAHRGSIALTSHPGRGTSFAVYLPAAEGASPQADEIPDEIETAEGRILVVDDEAPVRELYQAMLEAMGFTVICAVDGRDGLDVYRNHSEQIDLAIVDLIMPRLGGRECIEGLKELNPNLPIIISSGYSIGDEVAKVMQAGASAFIHKPFTMDELARAVTSLLRGSLVSS